MPIAARIDEFGKASLDRTDDLGLLGLVAPGPRHPRFYDWEWTNGLLESPRHEPLAGQNGPHAFQSGLVGNCPTLKRQSRFRRISRRYAAQAPGRATRVQGVPAAAAFCQRSGRIRPVHGRAPKPFRWRCFTAAIAAVTRKSSARAGRCLEKYRPALTQNIAVSVPFTA